MTGKNKTKNCVLAFSLVFVAGFVMAFLSNAEHAAGSYHEGERNDGLILGVLGGGGILAIAVIAVTIYIVVRMGREESEADKGSRLERKVEADTGLGRMAKANRNIQKQQKEEVRHAETQEKDLRSIFNKNLSPSEISVKEIAVDVAETVADSGRSEEAVSAAESRTIGLLAGIKEAEDGIKKYVNQERDQENSVEDGIRSILALKPALDKDARYAANDAAVVSHLKSLVGVLAGQVKKIQAAKSGELDNMNSLTDSLDLSVKESRKVLKNLKTETNVLNERENKERKDFSQDIAGLNKVLKTKKQELSKAEKEGKNSDAESLRKEIDMISRQNSLAEKLDKQLEDSFSRVKLSIIGCRHRLKRINDQEGRVKSFAGSSKKAKADAEAKVRALEKLSESLGGLASESGKQGDVHQIALPLSEALNLFHRDFKKAQEDSASFDASLKDILKAEYKIVRNVLAYERHIKSLAESDKAIDEGISTMTEIVKSISSEGEVGAHEEKVKGVLNSLRQISDREARMEHLVERNTVRLGRGIKEVIGHIGLLMQEDSKILSLADASSESIGGSLANLVNSKVGGRYSQSAVDKAEKFGRELGKKNKTAANQFNKAKNWENRARAK